MSGDSDPQQVPGGGSRVVSGDPFDPDDPGPWSIHGVAIGEGSETVGKSHERTRWPASVLREATDALAGKHILSDRDHDVGGQPGIDAVIGEVTATEYLAGHGIGYSGEVDDRAIAQKIARGRLDASPMLYRSLSDPDSEGVREATAIHGFDGLAVVREGAGGPRTTIQVGPNPSLASEAVEALSAAFEVNDGGRPRERGSVATGFSNMSEDEYKTRIEELKSERDSLADENTELRGTFAEALSDSMPFDAETIAERFEASELVAALSAAGESDESDRSAAEVLSGSVEPRSGGSNPGGKGAEALSASEKEDLSALRKRREALSTVASEDRLASIDAEIEALSAGE